jgi:hypothetical protein
MIISASRRTDIPAFYSEWFMNRIRAGYCEVPNPFNARQIARVSLAPQDVEAVVFWSKNPRPLLRSLAELDGRGIRYYFQFTINDYDEQLEPSLPPLSERLQTFEKLVGRIGERRVIWRYDPIIISTRTPYAFHEQTFRRLAERLRGLTRRSMVSIVDFYQKTDRRLSKLEGEGNRVDRGSETSPDMVGLLSTIRETAASVGIEVFSCAEKELVGTGIMPGRCVDSELIRSIWSVARAPVKKDSGQREACGCITSKDIGINDTCLHGCLYCYATRNPALARERAAKHDPRSPMLVGASATGHNSGGQLNLL